MGVMCKTILFLLIFVRWLGSAARVEAYGINNMNSKKKACVLTTGGNSAKIKPVLLC